MYQGRAGTALQCWAVSGQSRPNLSPALGTGPETKAGMKREPRAQRKSDAKVSGRAEAIAITAMMELRGMARCDSGTRDEFSNLCGPFY
jgi:hypothetical protein